MIASGAVMPLETRKLTFVFRMEPRRLVLERFEALVTRPELI
jgi:hypothetical protein